MTTPTLKGFNEYTADELRMDIPAGTYHLRVHEAEVGEWDDGRVRLDVSTRVASGVHANKFGPRMTWSLGDSDIVTADGREFHISAEDEAKKLIRDIIAIRNGKPVQLTSPQVYDERMLREIGKQITNDEFVATVGEDKNGYLKAKRVFSMSNPPKKFQMEADAAAFNLDEI